MVSNKFIEIHLQTMENFCNIDSCSQLKLFAYLICYLHKRQRWCELLRMHVILRCKLQSSPYFIHASLSREHFLTARIRVCRFDIDECNLCVRIELYEFEHWPMPICPTLWCPVNGDSMREREDGGKQFINRSTHFICLAELLIDKCVFRLVAIAQSLDTLLHTFSFSRSD